MTSDRNKQFSLRHGCLATPNLAKTVVAAMAPEAAAIPQWRSHMQKVG